MNAFKRNSKFGSKRSGDKPTFRHTGARSQSTMYPAVCSKCGNACEVPFRPDGQRPVSCKNCFVNTTPEDRGARFDRPERSYDAPRPSFRLPAQAGAPVAPVAVAKPDPRIDEIQRNIVKIQAQLERIIVSIATLKPKKQSSEE